MSLEPTIYGPMKWVPPPATHNGHGGGSAPAPVSPTPSYTTASSTSLSPSTSAPSTPAMSGHHDPYYVYDPRFAHHATPRYDDPRGPGGASWANPHAPASSSSFSPSPSPPPSWTSSPSLSRTTPLSSHHQHVPSPGGASLASGTSARSGYEGDRDDNGVGPAARPSSSSSTISSSSSSLAAPLHGGPGGPTRRAHRDAAVPTTTTARATAEAEATALLPAASRAMSLLEEAVEERASLAVAPRGKKGTRQCASQLRALNLFDAQYALGDDGDAPPSTPASIDDGKSDLDKIRQRGAGMRALALLNDTAAGEKHKGSPPTSSSKALAPGASHATSGGAFSGPPMTARRAAQLAHDKRQAEKDRVQAQLRKDLEMYGRRVPKIVVPIRKEAMAESTRPKKAATEDDVRDPETVSGMKCPLHWEREREAQVKALKLLNDESAAIVSIL